MSKRSRRGRRTLNRYGKAVQNTLEENCPEFDDIEWCPEFTADEDPDPLFDSQRGYVEQIDRYKRYQGKPTERKARKRDAP